jgi:hypothetical protein
MEKAGGAIIGIIVLVAIMILGIVWNWWPLSNLLLNIIPFFITAGIIALFVWGFKARIENRFNKNSNKSISTSSSNNTVVQSQITKGITKVLGHPDSVENVERLNGTMRDRETVMRGLDNSNAAQELVDAMRIHYNFIRPNQAIGGQTPAGAAGISLNLGENKIENLMRQAAISQNTSKVEPFIFELGVRANKLVISRKDDSIEIKTKEFLDKKNWREINEILLRNGFKWLSLGKDSCWIKKLQI